MFKNIQKITFIIQEEHSIGIIIFCVWTIMG